MNQTPFLRPLLMPLHGGSSPSGKYGLARRSWTRRILLSASALTLPLCPLAAGAQVDQEAPAGHEDATYTLNKIIVQARKRDEAITDIPETIDVITAEDIRKAGIASLGDVGRQTPNIVLNQRRDNEPNVVIRGVGGFGNTQGVGFYIDDVQNFTDQSAAISDVERIEILKGPQGTLYGGSNIGGAIKYVMKKPADTFGMDASAEYGSFGTLNLFAGADLPVSDTFATRVSAYSRETDGYMKNIFLGTEADESSEWGARIAGQWQPVDALTIDASYRHSSLINGGFTYVIAADGADYSRNVQNDRDTYTKRIIDGGIVNVSYDMGFADLTSVSSYTTRSFKVLLDLDYSPADGVSATQGDRNETNVLTQELRLTSSGSGPLTWLIGAYYANIDNRAGLNNLDLLLGVDAGGPILIEDFNNADTVEEQLAVFGTVGYQFDRFTIEGGLRVAQSKFSADFLSDRSLDAEVKDTIVLPKLTLSYDMTDNAMLYANVALGSEPGRSNAGNGVEGVTYEPEKATSYEAGIKGSSADGKFSYDLAAFFIDYRKRQFESRAVLPGGIITEFITNVGDSTSYGLEAGIQYRPTSEITLAASGGYLNAEWDDADALYNFEPIDGLTVPNSPELSANASFDWVKPAGNGLELGARADVSYVDSFYWQVLETAEQPSYQIVNLRLALSKPSAGWEIAVRGENVFNDQYFTEYTPDVFGPGLGLAAVGKPATVMVSIGLKY